jgi:hypothetical protein
MGMNLPDDTCRQLRHFSDEVQLHPQHALTPWARQRIYSLLGDYASPPGSAVCGWLAVIAAQRVLPLWESAKPEDNGPRELIELTISCLTGRHSYNRGQEIRRAYDGRFSVDAIAADSVNEPPSVWRAALAAATTFYELEKPHPFLSYLISENDTDQDIDPWAHDTALWAVEAESGGVWEENSDASKRLSFWKWWIAEAIPMAWSKANES